MTEKSFEDRRRERLERASNDKAMAQQLRKARCPVCQRPMLWHSEPGQPGTGTVPCKLDQGEVWELVTAKPAEEGSADPRAGLPRPAGRQGNLIGGYGTDAQVLDELREAGVQASKIVDGPVTPPRPSFLTVQPIPATGTVAPPRPRTEAPTAIPSPPSERLARPCWHEGCKRPAVVKIVNPEADRTMPASYGTPSRPSLVDSCRECADEAVRSRGR